jgi:hypothetical protein
VTGSDPELPPSAQSSGSVVDPMRAAFDGSKPFFDGPLHRRGTKGHVHRGLYGPLVEVRSGRCQTDAVCLRSNCDARPLINRRKRQICNGSFQKPCGNEMQKSEDLASASSPRSSVLVEVNFQGLATDRSHVVGA